MDGYAIYVLPLIIGMSFPISLCPKLSKLFGSRIKECVCELPPLCESVIGQFKRHSIESRDIDRHNC